MKIGIVAERVDGELETACRQFGLEPCHLPSVSLVYRHLVRGLEPDMCGLLVDQHVPGVGNMLSTLRAHPAGVTMPVIMRAPAPSDADFVRAHALGADDLIPAADPRVLGQRLNALAAAPLDSVRPRSYRGVALIAHPDSGVRAVLGRSLRLVGFDPAFAKTGEEVLERVSKGGVDLVVADASLGDPRAIFADRRDTENVACIWIAPSAMVADARAALASHGRAAVLEAGAPADHLIFYANELTTNVGELRREPRVLVSAVCAYRPEGLGAQSLGLTYNVSRDGLYIRTLAPLPERVHVWIELRLPTTSRYLHLRGTVVWRRQIGQVGGVTPCGFGVRIEPEACPPRDLEVWRDACGALLEQEITPRVVRAQSVRRSGAAA